MKKLFLIALLFNFKLNAQVIYSEKFSGLALQSYTSATGPGTYTDIPTGMQTIDDSRNNKTGTSLNPNTPFNNTNLKTRGWVVTSNSIDTFAVCTSWLDTATNSVNRWLITPTISVTNANSILSWRAKSPDPSYRDGYEVYIIKTNNSGSLTANNFALGDRYFILLDNNTSGGGEKPDWNNRSVNLLSFIGDTVRIAFRNNSKNRFQLWLDDIKVQSVSNNVDAEMIAAETTKYIKTGTQDSVKAYFTSKGASTIYSITLNYQVGNSSVYSFNFGSTEGWAYNSIGRVAFPITYSVGSSGRYPVNVWVSAVNGTVDQNNSNDTAKTHVSAQFISIPKTVLAEQFLSATNGDSPDGQEKLLSIQSNSLIVVNIHDNDSMAVPSMTPFIAEYKTANSTAVIDRNYFSDIKGTSVAKPSYYTKSNQRMAAVAPVSVSIVNKIYNSSTNEVVFTVKADFETDVVGDYRISAYLTENYVYGAVNDTSINGFNQYNDYHSVPWSPYYQLGYFSTTANTHVLNAWQYKHHNVLIQAPDGPYGLPGVITTTASTLAQSFTKSYIFTLPNATNGAHIYKADNIYIVGFVAEFSADKNKRTVLNAVKEKLIAGPEVISVNELETSFETVLYPNPSNGTFNIKLPESLTNEAIGVSIKDMLGRVVLNTTSEGINSIVTINNSGLQQGTYLVEISAKGKRSVKKLIIQE